MSQPNLYQVFEAFVAFGDRGTVAQIDSFRFAKLCRDCNLLDSVVTPVEVDLVFARVKSQGKRKIPWHLFCLALREIASVKFPEDHPDEAFDRISRLICRAGGPIARGTLSRPQGSYAKIDASNTHQKRSPRARGSFTPRSQGSYGFTPRSNASSTRSPRFSPRHQAHGTGPSSPRSQQPAMSPSQAARERDWKNHVVHDLSAITRSEMHSGHAVARANDGPSLIRLQSQSGESDANPNSNGSPRSPRSPRQSPLGAAGKRSVSSGMPNSPRPAGPSAGSSSTSRSPRGGEAAVRERLRQMRLKTSSEDRAAIEGPRAAIKTGRAKRPGPGDYVPGMSPVARRRAAAARKDSRSSLSSEEDEDATAMPPLTMPIRQRRAGLCVNTDSPRRAKAESLGKHRPDSPDSANAVSGITPLASAPLQALGSYSTASTDASGKPLSTEDRIARAKMALREREMAKRRAGAELELRNMFTAYASFGDRHTGVAELDGARFAKLCRECGVLGRGVTRTDVDICFARIKMPGLRVITFPQFRAAIQQLAIKRYPDEEGDGAYYKLIRTVLSHAGPRVNSSTPRGQQPAVYDRLTAH